MFRSDIAKLWTFVVASLVAAALLTPWLFDAGRALGVSTEHTPSSFEILNYLGEKARTHPYEDFFKRSLMICAVLLLYPTIRWIRSAKSEKADQQYALQKANKPAQQWLAGFLIAGGLLALLSLVLVQLGYFDWRDPIKWSKAFKKSIGPTLGAGIIEELVFRWGLFAIFLRAAKTELRATLGLTFLFAVLHFLEPPEGVTVDEANTTWSTGFWLVGQLTLNFLQPQFFIAQFATLFLIGLILARARLSTASLWMPIGLHMGWVFSYLFFKRIAKHQDNAPEWLVGGTLKEGALPLLTLLLTWLIMEKLILPRFTPKK